MKKQLLLLVLTMLPMLANADAVEIDGIYYNLITKGKVAEVTSNPNYYSGSVIIPEKITYEGTEYLVTNIGLAAFEWSSELTSITIPNSVISIGDEAFFGCRSLTSIIIPNSVASIGQYAFSGCSGLTSIDLPNSITSVTEGAFRDCTSLSSITIPSSATSIGYKSFAGCSNLVSITIPNSVISIGEYAFLSCTGLTSITFSNSLTSIAAWAFWNCTGLTSVTFPNSVTTINDFAFYECAGLTSITFGSGIRFIGLKAFASCPGLTDVYCYAKMVPSIYANAFESSYTEYATLHVPASSVNAYKETEPWKNFNKIVAIDGDTPETSKCSLPKISYKNGKLSFTCDTEGVDFISEITDTDIKKSYTKDVDLTVTYIISVYAAKTGFENSDVASATLCWIDVDPKTEGITNSVANVRALPVLIQNNGNVLSILGAPEGAEIIVYNISGQKVGSARAKSDSIDVYTSLQTGEVCIVKIGSMAVRVAIK